MTLDTRLYVLDPCDADELFHVAQTFIVPANRLDTCKISESETEVRNKLGQGFCAWLIVYRNRNGTPHRETVQPCCTENVCENGVCDPEAYPACYAELSLDTAYGYKGNPGDPIRASSCGELHAKILFELGQWLDDRGVSWAWANEFTGERWSGDDRYAHLGDLSSGSVQASEWFENVVKPVIFKKLSEVADALENSNRLRRESNGST